MPSTQRPTFEEQLNTMTAHVRRLGETVIQELDMALKALAEGDPVLAQRAIALDDEADRGRYFLEQDCLRLLTRQQPVASDLRAITGTLKLADDLERIGDHAVNLSKRVGEAAAQGVTLADGRVIAYGERGLALCRSALRALAENDRATAEGVLRQQSALHEEATDLETTLMREASAPGADVASLMGRLLAIHSFERAAAHAVNVAERTIFEITGRRPRRGV